MGVLGGEGRNGAGRLGERVRRRRGCGVCGWLGWLQMVEIMYWEGVGVVDLTCLAFVWWVGGGTGHGEEKGCRRGMVEERGVPF